MPPKSSLMGFLVLSHFHLFSTKQLRYLVRWVHITRLLKTLQLLLSQEKPKTSPWPKIYTTSDHISSCLFDPISYLFFPCKHISLLYFSSKHEAHPLLTAFVRAVPSTCRSCPHLLLVLTPMPYPLWYFPELSTFNLKPYLQHFLPCFIFHIYLSWADIIFVLHINSLIFCLHCLLSCPTTAN